MPYQSTVGDKSNALSLSGGSQRRGWNNSTGLPDGSSRITCAPPGPATISSVRNETPAARSRSTGKFKMGLYVHRPMYTFCRGKSYWTTKKLLALSSAKPTVESNLKKKGFCATLKRTSRSHANEKPELLCRRTVPSTVAPSLSGAPAEL
jgi:hypothetical protein